MIHTEISKKENKNWIGKRTRSQIEINEQQEKIDTSSKNDELLWL